MQNTKKQFTSFVIAGLITTAFQYAVLILLVEFDFANPVAASIVGATAGGILSYFINKHFTFSSKAKHISALPKFATVALIAISANTVLMYIFVELAKFDYIPAQIITTGAVIPITFGLNKIWSFAEPSN